MTKKPCLLVMAGGTGGHIFPGLAVADELTSQGWHIHWLGTANKMEADIVPKYGYDISFIEISGVRNNGLLAKVMMPIKLVKSLVQARRLIKSIKPDVGVGMGGYASAPGGIAALALKIPLVLQEQNAAAGLTNRLLSRFANKVCCAFPNAFASNIAAEVVGNPLRKSISAVPVAKTTEAKSKNILIVGGSLGAQILNQVVPSSYQDLATLHNDVNIHHQTGKGKQKQVLESYEQALLASDRVQVSEFITDMAAAYQWADVVICRAGALTVSEVAMAGKAAIFIPLPHAVDDHQTKNAQYLVSRGAAKLLPQAQLSSANLTALLNELFSDDDVLIKMAEAALQAADQQATAKVSAFCQKLFDRKNTST
jgi:UDP-N-acetylglucosamine--N-acetylmuramyl-(pentapeptide) pyrophosphoryl-undecaprenol N-acetylglucosamine transferase